MKKQYALVCTGIVVIILTICVIRIFQSIFTLTFFYGPSMLCSNREKEYIKESTGVNTDFKIIACEDSWNGERGKLYILKKFPSVFKEVIEINDFDMAEYVTENSNQGIVMLYSIFPYVLLSIITLIFFNKKVIKYL